jgi:hypothetical protein
LLKGLLNDALKETVHLDASDGDESGSGAWRARVKRSYGERKRTANLS